MSAKPISRVGDSAAGICTAHKNPRSWIGVITTGSSVGSCDGQAIARVGDVGTTDCGHNFRITAGSSVGTCDGLAIARVGDPVIVIEGGSGVLTSGSEVGSVE